MRFGSRQQMRPHRLSLLRPRPIVSPRVL
jgi:hypothetical protein